MPLRPNYTQSATPESEVLLISLRLLEMGNEFGLIDDDILRDVKERKKQIAHEVKRIESTVIKPNKTTNDYLLRKGTKPINNGIYLDRLLKRAELDYTAVKALARSSNNISEKVAKQVEIEVKYEGYIKRQLKEIDKFKNQERMKIPEDFDFTQVHGLSNELKEKLSTVMPSSLGQTSRIDGITPAGLSVIMIAIKAAEKQGAKTKNQRSNDP